MDKGLLTKKTAVLMVTMATLIAFLYSVTRGVLTIRPFDTGSIVRNMSVLNQGTVSVSTNVPKVTKGVLTIRPFDTGSIVRNMSVLNQGTVSVSTNVPKDIEKWDVLVSTYMRSGSTFVGKLLGWRQDSFYFYEPFWKMHTWKYVREDSRLCNYYQNTCSNNGDDAVDAALAFLSGIYSCSFTEHGSKFSEGLHANLALAGPSWNTYNECRNKEKAGITECLSRVESVCRNATHRVTKVLRLDVLLTTRLLEKHPRLKVILLLRDPRGVINSHVQASWYPVTAGKQTVRDDIQVLCSRIDRDIAAIKQLQGQYGNRVRIVQYEDFDDPIEKAHMLYRYLGMDVKEVDTEMLHDLTKDKKQQTQDGYHPFTYRTTLDWDTVHIMQTYCSNVYQNLGLINYANSSQLKNLSISAIKTTLPYTLH